LRLRKAEFDALGAEIRVVLRGDPHRTAVYREKVQHEFPILADPAGRASAQFGVSTYNSWGWWNQSTWFVIDRQGVVSAVSRPGFTNRGCDLVKESDVLLEEVKKAAGRPEPRLVREWGKKGEQPGEFHSPIGIAINAKDEVYVTDLNNARLQKFTSEGEHLGGFELPLDNVPKRRTSQAGGIALDRDGLIYLSFMSQHRIGVFTDGGKLVREWGRKGKGDGEFDQPGGLLLAADGTILVADQGNHRIQRFTREGKFLASWGGHGTAPGQFDGVDRPGSRFGGPHFVAQDGKGRLYTTEGVLGRVQQFSPDGKPLLAWGDKGQQAGGIGALKTPYSANTFGPIGVFVDPLDRVWISSLNDRVQAFTADGKFLFAIAGRLARPHGMAMDRKGRLYVADAGNQRIQVYEVP
jgi:sugar lactone lactonase YvrE